MVSYRLNQIIVGVCLVIIIFLIVQEWYFSLLLTGAMLFGQWLGRKLNPKAYELTSKKRFQHAKWMPAISIILLILLYFFMSLPMWKFLAVGALLVVITILELTDSYLWYKKETTTP